MTIILSLIVTAVGRLGVLRCCDRERLDGVRECENVPFPLFASGITIVPFPRGFLTFLMRIGIGGLAWMT